MENADLLIAVGTRAVCQSDCSRTGYPNVKRVININADLDDATHYNHTLALVGDVHTHTGKAEPCYWGQNRSTETDGITACAEKKAAWQSFKEERGLHPGPGGRILGAGRC